jgi:hypothetical protein
MALAARGHTVPTIAALGKGQEPESNSGEARGRRGLGAAGLGWRPIDEAVIVVLLGFLIGIIAAAVVYFAKK